MFYVSLLRLYSGGTTLGPPDPIMTAGEEEEYQVESILMDCWQEQAMEYLVHWYTYDKAEDSWVSEQDFVYAQQISQ